MIERPLCIYKHIYMYFTRLYFQRQIDRKTHKDTQFSLAAQRPCSSVWKEPTDKSFLPPALSATVLPALSLSPGPRPFGGFFFFSFFLEKPTTAKTTNKYASRELPPPTFRNSSQSMKHGLRLICTSSDSTVYGKQINVINFEKKFSHFNSLKLLACPCKRLQVMLIWVHFTNTFRMIIELNGQYTGVVTNAYREMLSK